MSSLLGAAVITVINELVKALVFGPRASATRQDWSLRPMHPRAPGQDHTTRALIMLALALAYLLTFGFAGVFDSLSLLDRDAFSHGVARGWELLTFVYFSTATFATVGYGEITPRSDVARAIVTTQILVTPLYAAFVGTFLSARLRARDRSSDERSEPVS
jgi:hypothetical protein